MDSRGLLELFIPLPTMATLNKFPFSGLNFYFGSSGWITEDGWSDQRGIGWDSRVQ